MDLRPKERRFVEEYLIDLNATQAAIRAGYAPNSADVTGARLLAKARVAEAVREAKARRSKRTAITQDRVLEELAAIAFVDLRTLFDDKGRLREVNELDEPIARALASVEVVREKTTKLGDSESGIRIDESVIKVKVWDKVRALELAGKHLGMWNERAGSGEAVEPLKIEVTHRRAAAPHAR